ncbi:uncharacterized protein LOC131619515 [Vicia villosa]|uniref:uncharacterized protein LOC131619515 n=1 Tax=Vicia villosa TaxID=3911 RepID=UPI00273A9B45|nr:uncharacterized protein LOC131619515 [Vicia villosa]
MDKEWTKLPWFSQEYINGVTRFLDFAFTKGSPQGGELLCPCAKCKNIYWKTRDIIRDHLIAKGFLDGYDVWVHHGEKLQRSMEIGDGMEDQDGSHDDIPGLLHDIYGDRAEAHGVGEGPNDEARTFYSLIKEAEQELYPGCKDFSSLSFTIRLYLLKCLHGWSNTSFTALLELLKEAMPDLNIPESFYKTKAMISGLGLDYKKIDACPNDCMLFWKEHEKDNSCTICEASRWKQNAATEGCESEQPKNDCRVPAKVLRHFPLIPRLQRLFMCSKTAESMRWHEEERSKDGKLRHPADGKAWKDFDELHPDFSSESRNVRLGLTSDGFNPFRTMSLSHSTWPVLMMVYNTPPWLSMKPEYTMLSLLIPGPKSPGNDIDVYLQPLIEELKELWESGIETYDSSMNQTFQMRAALLWTISDYPAYAMLSGWSTKGKLACACCKSNTNSLYLKHSHKMCYMDHRTFLPRTHSWRDDVKSFNGEEEHRTAPSIIVGTLLDIMGKTKDHIKARYDLQEMGIREKLHPREIGGGRSEFAKACFSMTPHEKSIFCGVIKAAKLPDGTASNISKCVQVGDRKISGYKSHDAHFMLHYLLQIAVRSTMPKEVATPLIRLGSFFRSLCQKVIQVEDLDYLENEIAEILCQLEMIFPPSFFDIMVHLPIHLVNEVRLGGPVQFRWMYPTERYLCKLKNYVRNRAYPEGSIAKGYLAEEAITFCSRYLHSNVDTRFNRKSRNYDVTDSLETDPDDYFTTAGRPLGGAGKPFHLDVKSKDDAHRYILFNCNEVQIYISEHDQSVNSNTNKRKWTKAKTQSKEFSEWFKTRAQNDDVPLQLEKLSRGPNFVAKRYPGYVINGYRFHTRKRDTNRKTQNSGVTLVSLTSSFASSKDGNPRTEPITYYGTIVDIIELYYYGNFNFVLFKCDWFEVEKDKYGLTCVRFNKKIYQNDPFVLPSQVHQCYYVQDPFDPNRHYALQTVPRDFFNIADPSNLQAESGENSDGDGELNWVREDIPATIAETPYEMNEAESDGEDFDYDDTLFDFMD